jgi:hypothetical protein
MILLESNKYFLVFSTFPKSKITYIPCSVFPIKKYFKREAMQDFNHCCTIKLSTGQVETNNANPPYSNIYTRIETEFVMLTQKHSEGGNSEIKNDKYF